MGDVAIVTANFGHFDDPQPQTNQDIDVDWFMVTDQDLLAPGPWERVLADGDDLHPCIAAKRYRTEPWCYFPHKRFIWIDANMSVTSPSFAREVLDCLDNGLATWRHPRRDCVYEEAEASVGAEGQNGKYDPWPIREQAEHYREQGHPERWGLWATGTIAWDATDKRIRAFGKDWLAECKRWSIQDQISFPIVCRKHEVRPGEFPHRQIQSIWAGVMQNPWLQIHPHR